MSMQFGGRRPRSAAVAGLAPAAALMSMLLSAPAVAWGDERGAAPGACCLLTGACFQNATPGQCVDLGGIWHGEGTTCATVTCVLPPACPPGAIQENEPGCGQPAPDNFNSGCGLFPSFYTLSGCGQTICGTLSADARSGGAGRDVDAFMVTVPETQRYRICVTAPLYPEIQVVRLTPGIDPCQSPLPYPAAAGQPGEPLCIEFCVLRNVPYSFQISTANADGLPQREGIACTPYVMTVDCLDCIEGACCLGTAACVTGFFTSGPYAGDIVAQVNCEAQGGVYLGDGASCAGVTCSGACCLPNGTCGVMARTACFDQGGAWYEGTECADVEPCPVCSPEDPNDLDGLDGPDENCDLLPATEVNVGCGFFGDGTRFGSLVCGQTVCGTTAFDGFLGDSDWFHLNLASTTDVTFRLENLTVGRMQLLVRWYSVQVGLPACPSGPGDMIELLSLPAITSALPGGTLEVVVTLPAGRFTVVAAHQINPLSPSEPVPCPSPYRLTVECRAGTCNTTCSDTENEPTCGEHTEINPGCFGATGNGPFSTLPIGQTVCGTSRVVRGMTAQGAATLVRDFDWWRVTVPSSGDYEIFVRPEFHAYVALYELEDDQQCTGLPLLSGRIFRCNPLEGDRILVPNLPAGTYAVLVTPEQEFYRALLIGTEAPAGIAEACPAFYQLRFGPPPEDCAACGDSNLSGNISVGDIGPFVVAVSQGFAAWDALLPGAQTMEQFLCVNDTDRNGVVSVGDIGAFVATVASGQSQCGQ
jgi:hypothetical protein